MISAETPCTFLIVRAGRVREVEGLRTKELAWQIGLKFTKIHVISPAKKPKPKPCVPRSGGVIKLPRASVRTVRERFLPVH